MTGLVRLLRINRDVAAEADWRQHTPRRTSVKLALGRYENIWEIEVLIPYQLFGAIRMHAKDGYEDAERSLVNVE